MKCKGKGTAGISIPEPAIGIEVYAVSKYQQKGCDNHVRVSR